MDNRKINLCLTLMDLKNTDLNTIAKHLEKSTRAVRKDIEEINYFLHKKNIDEILVDNNEITWNIKKEVILNVFNNLSYYEYSLDSVERRVVIILFSMLNRGYFTINDLLELIQVSRTTIINDIKKVKEIILNYNYELISEPAKGMYLFEKNKKYKMEIIVDLINFDMNNIIRFFNQEKIKDYILNEKSIFNEIEELINISENKSGYILTNFSFRLLKYFLIIYIYSNPISNKKYNEKIDLINGNTFSSILIKKLIQKFNLNFDGVDILNIQRLIKTLNYSRKVYSDTDILKSQIVTRKFIEKISNYLNINFNNDEKLLKNLSDHISSMVSNPISKIKEYSYINEYIEDYSEIIKAVSFNVDGIEKLLGRKLNEIEINFIVIYIITAIERKKNEVADVNIAVVCTSGIGTSLLIKEQIKKISSNLNISLFDAQNYKSKLEKLNFDIVVSTINLDSKLDYLKVKPILAESDISRLMEKIDLIKLKKVAKIVNSEKIGIEDKINQANNYPRLTDLLNKSNIEFDIYCDNWQEAVRKAGEKLEERGYINDYYIEKMIENIDLYGPYIVISKGVAIPHAASEHGVKKSGMSMIKLKMPVKFGADDLDPVSFVVALASVNNEHFNAFFDFVNGLQNLKIKEKFMQAKNRDEMFLVLKEMEEKNEIE